VVLGDELERLDRLRTPLGREVARQHALVGTPALVALIPELEGVRTVVELRVAGAHDRHELPDRARREHRARRDPLHDALGGLGQLQVQLPPGRSEGRAVGAEDRGGPRHEVQGEQEACQHSDAARGQASRSRPPQAARPQDAQHQGEGKEVEGAPVEPRRRHPAGHPPVDERVQQQRDGEAEPAAEEPTVPPPKDGQGRHGPQDEDDPSMGQAARLAGPEDEVEVMPHGALRAARVHLHHEAGAHLHPHAVESQWEEGEGCPAETTQHGAPRVPRSDELRPHEDREQAGQQGHRARRGADQRGRACRQLEAGDPPPAERVQERTREPGGADREEEDLPLEDAGEAAHAEGAQLLAEQGHDQQRQPGAQHCTSLAPHEAPQLAEEEEWKQQAAEDCAPQEVHVQELEAQDVCDGGTQVVPGHGVQEELRGEGLRPPLEPVHLEAHGLARVLEEVARGGDVLAVVPREVPVRAEGQDRAGQHEQDQGQPAAARTGRVRSRAPRSATEPEDEEPNGGRGGDLERPAEELGGQ